jgi:hypothetical protein
LAVELRQIASIATDVARHQNASLEVVGVTPGAGGGTYAEVVMVVKGCHREPCTILLGVLRDMPESEVRSAIAEKLRHHLAEHPQ